MSTTKEVIKSELDVFSKVFFQRSIEHSIIVEYRPNNALTEGNSIEFLIPSSPDEYTDLQHCYLSLKGKLVKQDGSNYEEDDNGRNSLIPYALFTIWDQISVFLNQTLISQASNTNAYLQYIEATLESTPDKIATFLHSAGYRSPFGKENYNCDLVDQDYAAYFDKSKSFTFYGRMHGSLFNSDKLLLNGVEIRLMFNRGPNQFICMGSAAVAAGTNPVTPPKPDTTPKLILEDVSLFVRKCRISKSILDAHEAVLQQKPALYPIHRSLLKVVNLPAGQNTFFIDNLHSGQLPSKLILCFTTNTAFSGSYTLGPFKFAHYDLTHLVVNMNNEHFPKIPYHPNYDDNNYQREYYDFFLNIGATKGFEQPGISYKHFKECMAFYAFNFNADFENVEASDWISVPRIGFLNVELKFKTNLPEALKMICYFVNDNLIQIDQKRNVLINY